MGKSKVFEKVCLIDIDGTLLESFKSIYTSAIEEIFGYSKLAMRLNKFFYNINDYDVISNTMGIFKLVIFILSVVSCTSFKKNLKKFEELYIEKSKREIIYNYESIVIPIEKRGYKVFLITHDEYARRFNAFIPTDIIVTKSKTLYVFEKLRDVDIMYMIGNNLCDDLIPAIMLNKKYKKIGRNCKVVPIYIGTSNIVKRILKKKILSFKRISSVLDVIKKR